MEKSGLWTKRKTADFLVFCIKRHSAACSSCSPQAGLLCQPLHKIRFLFADMIDDPKKRLVKLNNWISRKIIPKKVMDKA